MAKSVEYRIEYSRNAESHLEGLNKRDQVSTIEAIDDQLRFQPTVETRRRKRLPRQPNCPLGTAGCVFYDVTDDPALLVQILAVGVKTGNRLVIGEETVEL